MSSDQESTGQAVRQAFEFYLKQKEAGQEPDFDAFCASRPDLAFGLRVLKSLYDLCARSTRVISSESQRTVSDISSPLRLEPGEMIGHFRIVKKLEEGGMGAVHLAKDTKLDRLVAIKSLRLASVQDPGARARLKREAQLLASLTHPHIAAIYHLEEVAGFLFLILEYVPGETLRQKLAPGPLSLVETVSIGGQICKAMAAAHDKGVIHRDLKPGNVMITPEGCPKILDFGLAKAVGTGWLERRDTASLTHDGDILGSPAYMSPEQAQGLTADHRADIWGFGCTMYHMLIGKQPFTGETTRDLIASIVHVEPDWDALPSDASPVLRDLLRRCLAKDADDRWDSFSEVARVLSHVTEGRTAAVSAQRGALNNLPRQLTRFIGREKELAAARKLLDQTALLTLTGPGGCGKTRLGLELAAQVCEEYPDGVWLAELASLDEPALVPRSVASALKLKEVPGRTITEILLDFLKEKQLLVVLDSCEHVLNACVALCEVLLHSCRHLRILASSREALGLPGEVQLRVPCLSTPPLVAAPDAGSLLAYESVRLFQDRASIHKPGFEVNGANAAAVARICCRLDGIPLAVELAAARVNVLSVEQIAAKLQSRFKLLTGGSRTALPRQQTLQALFDWSYDLLNESEKALFRSLSVFRGGVDAGGGRGGARRAGGG